MNIQIEEYDGSTVEISKTIDGYKDKILIDVDDELDEVINKLQKFRISRAGAKPPQTIVVSLPKEIQIVNKMVKRLNFYEKQLQSRYGLLNKQKISHKVAELKKCIKIVQSV